MDTKFFYDPFATSGDRTAVPDAVQVDGTVSWTQGWGPDYSLDPESDPDSLLLTRQQTNEIIYSITASLGAIQTDFPEWASASDNGGTPFSYNSGAVVRYTTGGLLYQSIVGGNTATPGTDPTKWVLFLSQYATTVALAAEIAARLAAEALLAPITSPVFLGSPQAPTQNPGDVSAAIATDAFVAGAVQSETNARMAADALLAPKANPTLTGSVVVPQYAPGTNSGLVASTGYTDAAVAVETNRATNAESQLAPLNSPFFTGSPQCPTPDSGGAATLMANLAYVRGVLGNNNISQNGYIAIDKWIIQWVVGVYDPADSSEPSYTLNWPLAFNGGCMMAMVSCDLANPTAGMDSWYQTTGWTNTGVGIQRQHSGAPGDAFNQPSRAVAIGIGLNE